MSLRASAPWCPGVRPLEQLAPMVSLPKLQFLRALTVTLAKHVEITENKTALSLAVTILTSPIEHKLFICHSHENTRPAGRSVGTVPRVLLLPSTLHVHLSTSSPGRQPQVTSHASPITSQEPRVTAGHQPT